MEGVSSKPIGKLIVALICAKFEQLDISHFISIPALNFCWKMEAKKNYTLHSLAQLRNMQVTKI